MRSCWTRLRPIPILYIPTCIYIYCQFLDQGLSFVGIIKIIIYKVVHFMLLPPIRLLSVKKCTSDLLKVRGGYVSALGDEDKRNQGAQPAQGDARS